VVLVVGISIFSAKLIYDNLIRASRVNPVLVQSYQLHLKIGAIKESAQAFEEKGNKLNSLLSEMQENKREEEEKQKEQEKLEQEQEETMVQEEDLINQSETEDSELENE
jgi:hypothetical protein